MLPLDSPEWNDLPHVYGDEGPSTPILLQRLYDAKDDVEFEDAFAVFWNAVFHQFDFRPASFAVIPHLVRMCDEASEERTDLLAGAIANIELARKWSLRRGLCLSVDPRIEAEYYAALDTLPGRLSRIESSTWSRGWAIEFVSAALIAKGHDSLGSAVRLTLSTFVGVHCRRCGLEKYELHGSALPGKIDLRVRRPACSDSLAMPDESLKLHIHVYRGDGPMLLVCLAENAGRIDVDEKDGEGWTALHWAAYLAIPKGRREQMVRVLLDAGADPLARTAKGETPLDIASRHGNLLVMRWLKERCGDAAPKV